MVSMPCSLLIPAAGDSVRFREKTSIPKGLIKFNWRGRYATMIEHIVPEKWHGPIHVMCKDTDEMAFLSGLNPDYGITATTPTSGQAETVRDMCYMHPAKREVMVVNSDNAFDPGVLQYFLDSCRQKHACVGAITFMPSDGLERYGYVNAHPDFMLGAEKQPISKYALAGAFYFQSADLVTRRHKPEMRYVSEWFLDMPKPKLSVCISAAQFQEWGTAEMLEQSVTDIEWENTNVLV